jgi:hypothetical protein
MDAAPLIGMDAAKITVLDKIAAKEALVKRVIHDMLPPKMLLSA